MQLLPIAMGAAGSLIGNKLAKSGPSDREKQVMGQDARAQSMSLDAGSRQLPGAQNLIGMGSAGYQPVLNYWSRILSGNRGDMTAAMGPEISRIGEGYQAAAQTSTALNPRGGPSAEFNAELPYMQQRDVTSLLQQARPAAAQGLLSGAQGATSAGSQVFNNATAAILNSTTAGRDILNNEQVRKAREAENAKSIGKGLFDLISKYGPEVISLIQKGRLGTGAQGPTTTTTTTRQPVEVGK